MTHVVRYVIIKRGGKFAGVYYLDDNKIGKPVEVTQICYPWTEYFAILPRRSINGRKIFWEKAYKRKVWVVWGQSFHMEPEVQYATLFDLLEKDPYETLYQK